MLKNEALRRKQSGSDAVIPSEVETMTELAKIYKARQARWDELGHTHELSFLFGAYDERVYW